MSSKEVGDHDLGYFY